MACLLLDGCRSSNIGGGNEEDDVGTKEGASVGEDTQGMAGTDGPPASAGTSGLGGASGVTSTTDTSGTSGRVLAPPTITSTHFDTCEGAASTLTWAVVDGLTYEIQLDNTSSLATSTPSAGPHQWRVRANDGVLTSAWSASNVFTHFALPAAPVPAASDLCLSLDAVTTWTTVPGTTYSAEFWNGSAWVSPDMATQASASVIAPSGGTGYKWRITAAANGCTASAESASFAVHALANVKKLLLSTSATTIDAAFDTPQACPVDSVVVVRKIGSPPTSRTDGTELAATLHHFSDATAATGVVNHYRIYAHNADVGDSSGVLFSAIAGTTAVVPVRITQPLAVDGRDDEAAWADAPLIPYSFDQAWGESRGLDPAITGYVRLSYDADALYVFLHADDKFVHVDGTAAWEDDSVELFFDLGLQRVFSTVPDSDNFHLIITPDANVSWLGRGTGADWGWDTTWDAGMTLATVVDGTLNNEGDEDTGWNVEVRLPFANMTPIADPRTIGFTFWINEDDTVNANQQHWYQWTPGTVSVNEATWGICQF